MKRRHRHMNAMNEVGKGRRSVRTLFTLSFDWSMSWTNEREKSNDRGQHISRTHQIRRRH